MIGRALLAAVVVSQLGVSAGLAQTTPAQPAPTETATQITPCRRRR
jgi:hypothetical protein